MKLSKLLFGLLIGALFVFSNVKAEPAGYDPPTERTIASVSDVDFYAPAIVWDNAYKVLPAIPAYIPRPEFMAILEPQSKAVIYFANQPPGSNTHLNPFSYNLQKPYLHSGMHGLSSGGMGNR